MLNEERGWTFDLVEERLVDAVRLWRRSPGGGKWPFASDGPWHLVQRETVAGDYDARGGDMKEAALKPLPLGRGEVAMRDQASEWLRFVTERDRRLVVLAVVEQAMTGRRVDWMRMRVKMGVGLGAEGLRKRYSRAITAIVRELDARRVPVAA